MCMCVHTYIAIGYWILLEYCLYRRLYIYIYIYTYYMYRIYGNTRLPMPVSMLKHRKLIGSCDPGKATLFCLEI